MVNSIPKTIEDYLDQLRRALAGADPALRQDALYDAEEYLRAELAANAGRPQSEIIASIVSSYGAPEEVARIYRETEEKVSQAMRTPRPEPQASPLGRFFGVYADPRAYSSLFYMLIALATGVFYFVWAVAGLSLSVGFMILIIGVPFFLLFLSSVRLFSLLEGRIVETFLGVRMPRRPVYEKKDKPILTRIGEMLSDARTWSTLVYLLLMLPLGVAYFVIAVTTVVTSVAFILSPLAEIVTVTLDMDFTPFYWHGPVYLDWWESILLSASGVILLTAALHLFKGIGYMQGRIARGLLVKYAE